MSNLNDYTLKLETINVIPDKETMTPNSVPVDAYLQEAENLYHWCQEDKDDLTARNIDWAMVEDIPVRCGALREAQSRWITTRFSHEESEREWVEKSPLAYDFRNELLHTFRFAYRNNPDLLGRVNTISQGYGHADMIQDLNDLCVLGKNNSEPLKQINFDILQLDEAAAMADDMSRLLGATTTERAESSEAIKLRNKAFTHLKEAVDEVRNFGQYVFWRNETRVKGYASSFLRRYRRKSGDKLEETAVPAV